MRDKEIKKDAFAGVEVGEHAGDPVADVAGLDDVAVTEAEADEELVDEFSIFVQEEIAVCGGWRGEVIADVGGDDDVKGGVGGFTEDLDGAHGFDESA